MRFKILLILLPTLLFSRNPYMEPWGRDAGLKIPPAELPVEKPSIPMRIANAVIRFHQDVLSPTDGPRSAFRPTSSRYMQLSMQRYGVVKGLLMGFDRLMRENEDKWIYPTVEIDGKTYKYDPAWIDKNHGIPQ